MPPNWRESFETVARRFLPPRLAASAEAMEKTRVVVVISFLGILVSLGFGTFYLLVVSAYLAGGILLGAGLLCGLAAPLWRKTGSSAATVLLIGLTLTVLTVALSWLQGRFEPAIFAFLALVPLIATQLWTDSGARLIVLGNSAVVAVFAIAMQLSPDHEPAFPATAGERLALDALGTISVIGLVYWIARTQAIARALAEEMRKNVEARDLQSQRLESIGLLAGGVAHDFNNLLAVMKGASELALFRAAEGDPLRQDLEDIRNAADRAAGLTRQLLLFSRREPTSVEVIDLREIVENLSSLLRRTLPSRVSLQTVMSGADHLVRGDLSQLEQVVMNLAINGRDAIVGPGELTITLRVDDGWVKLDVKDTGQGIPPDVKDRIFEPFFTTKDRHSGTGLGLATVYGIVTGMGGDITVDSTVGKGSRFSVRFPRALDERGMPARVVRNDIPDHTPMEAIARPGRVLLVEDDVQLRTLARRVLESAGFSVVAASTGQEAIDVIRTERPAAFSLVLTDVGMPDVSGPALLEWVRQHSRTLPVVFMSGYGREHLDGQLPVDTSAPMLNKPFSPTDLVAFARAHQRGGNAGPKAPLAGLGSSEGEPAEA